MRETGSRGAETSSLFPIGTPPVHSAHAPVDPSRISAGSTGCVLIRMDSILLQRCLKDAEPARRGEGQHASVAQMGTGGGGGVSFCFLRSELSGEDEDSHPVFTPTLLLTLLVSFLLAAASTASSSQHVTRKVQLIRGVKLSRQTLFLKG